MKPDLTLLYSELGLKPNCSLAELQLAYRRRISELQPRRLAGVPPSPESSDLLRALLWLYSTATRFHRRYGRLPGAAPQRTGAGGTPYLPRTYIGYSSPSSSGHPEPPSRLALGLAVVLLVLLFVLLAVVS